jgi:hypothetical protein
VRQTGSDPFWLEDHNAHPGKPDEVYRFLAERRGEHIKRHHVMLRAQYFNMRFAILAFAFSVGAWLLQVGGDEDEGREVTRGSPGTTGLPDGQ